MRIEIPSPIISFVAAVIERRETHATMNSLFLYANAPGDAPEGNKLNKATEWLRRVNKVGDDSLRVFGKLTSAGDTRTAQSAIRPRWNVVGALGVPSRTLDTMLREFDFAAVDHEFERALGNVESEPREAVLAASNILKSLCKAYIAEAGLTLPQRQDLKPLWELVRKGLGFDPGRSMQTGRRDAAAGGNGANGFVPSSVGLP